MKDKLLSILFLSIVFLFFICPKAYAMDTITELEVIVPDEGWTDIDLKNEIFIYRGCLGSPVKVLNRSPQMCLTAVEIDYDLKKQLLAAKKEVNVQVEGEETTLISEGMKLVTESFIYQIQDSFFEADGGFFLTKEDWSLSGRHLEGNLNENTIEATGELRFVQGTTEGKAETLSYSENEEKVILTGSPIIRWEEGCLEGEKDTVIIYYLDTGKIKAEGPTNIKFFQEIEVSSGGN